MPAAHGRTPPSPPARLAGTPSYDAHEEPAEAVLPLVPATATTLTVTDLDGVRRQLGVPGPDQRRPDVGPLGVLGAGRGPRPRCSRDGMLREDTSELMLDYGFTEDDVDWEAHFTGPDGNGYVLAFRPGPGHGARSPARSRPGSGRSAGAGCCAATHLVVSGVADDGAASWATDPAVVHLVGEPAEATYLRRGCVPLADALGPEATAEEQDAVLARHDVTDLDAARRLRGVLRRPPRHRAA